MKYLALILFILLADNLKQDVPSVQDYPGLQAQVDSLKNGEVSKEVKASLALRALQDSDTISNPSVRSEFLTELSYTSMKQLDSAFFRRINTGVRARGLRDKDTLLLANSAWDLGIFMEDRNLRDSAFYYFAESRDYFQAFGDLYGSGRMHLAMAKQQNWAKDHIGAETSALAGVRDFEKIQDTINLFYSFNELGIIAKDMGDYEQALDYYDRAENYLGKLKDPGIKRNILANNRGNVYRDIGDYRNAQKYYESSLTDGLVKEKNQDSYARTLTNLGKVLFEQGDMENALTRYTEALELRKQQGKVASLASISYYLAEYWLGQNDTTRASAYLEDALNYAQEGGDNDRLLELYPLAARIHPEQATEYMQAYAELSEKIIQEERQQRNKFARIRFQTQEYIDRARLLTERQQLYAGVALGVLLLGISVIVIIYQRIRNQKLRFEQQQQATNQEIFTLLLSQNEKIEEGKSAVQKQISEELHDGVLGAMNGIRMVLLGLNGREDEASIKMRAEALEKLKSVQEEIRTISHQLSDAAYRQFHNFVISIEEMVREVCDPAGLKYHFEYDNDTDWDGLGGEVKINLYRILQECLQNVIKHAKASLVTITMEQRQDHLCICVKDDGVGFRKEIKKKGIGQKNINSRVESLKGKWKLISSPGKGTEIQIEIPYGSEKEIEVREEMVIEE
ncbi:tetratricopeptide repeat-containing sensor histidine kinase [Robiginitalea sp. IMCC44478]|uniref:tetratricopeptide repeat-containing sensor histidine kinase n=1 Tax=Robiginitalea sp. IMCC44478 TaxID=3459122 RepID=UPI00404109E2